VLGPARFISVEVILSHKVTAKDDVRDLLAEAASVVGDKPRIEITSLDADGAKYRITVRSDALNAKSRLYMIVAQALAMADVPLGRRSGRPE
jgi:hypothetical protein